MQKKLHLIKNVEAEEFEVKDLKSAKNFNKSEQDSPVYGIRFTDGTNMHIAYKKDCKGISEGDTRGNHTQCLLYVYDVNASSSYSKLQQTWPRDRISGNYVLCVK